MTREHSKIAKILITVALVAGSGCSITPGGKNNGSEAEQGGGDILSLKFRALNRPFRYQDFSNTKFRLDAGAPLEDQLHLMGSEGKSWSLSPEKIDEVDEKEIGVEFEDHVLSFVSVAGYLWRLDVTTVQRSLAPLDFSADLDAKGSLDGYEEKGDPSELTSKGALNVLGLSNERLVTSSEKELFEYAIREEAITRKKIKAPFGAEDWSEFKVKAFGECLSNCSWFLTPTELILFLPREGNIGFSNGDWSRHNFRVEGVEDVEAIVSLNLSIELNDQNAPEFTKPSFMTSNSGIFISELGSDLIFTSRTFDEEAKYSWDNVIDLARDYCVSCHTGYLGLETEDTWLSRKDYILKFILPESKQESYSMPKLGSNQAKSMTDDERKIMAAWLRDQGADESKVKDVGNGIDGSGVKRFELSAELLGILDPSGYAGCLAGNCHGNTANGDDMRLKSWWLNPVRANRSGQQGKQAAILSLETTANWKMPRGRTLSAAQITELKALFEAVDLD